MSPDAQSSFVSKNITDFGVTESGVDELIEAVETIRMHANTWASVNKAKKLIKDATDNAEAPTFDAIGEALRGGITAQIDEALPTLQQQIANIGATDDQAFLALGAIGQSLGFEVTLAGIDPDTGQALLKAKGRTKLLKTPREFISYIAAPEKPQEADLGDLEIIADEITGSEVPTDAGSAPDPV